MPPTKARTLPLGPVMLDVQGHELTQEECELLQHPAVGGVILFARNYHSKAQVQALCQQIRQLREPHLLIAVDQEGGRVQRFQDGFVRLPSLGTIGRVYQDNAKQGLELAREMAWLMASEVLNVGVDISFAPVLDVNVGVSTVIGDRSFSVDPNTIATLGAVYIEGLTQAGMGATGKHFPGHGSVAADSHIALPKDPRDKTAIQKLDLIPFVELAPHLRGIMPAHVIYPRIDELPAGFSRIWLQEILRQQLGFTGLIFSDDLSMAGAALVGDHIERAKIAFEAGCDMVLVCNDRDNAIKIVERYASPKPQSALQYRIQNLYGKVPVIDQQRHAAAVALLEKL